MLKTQLFLGYRISPELNVLLRGKVLDALLRINHESKEFLGTYIKETGPDLKKIEADSRTLLDSLQNTFPAYPFNVQWITLFPVLLIG